MIPFDRVIWNAQDCADYFKKKRPEFLRTTRWENGFPKEVPGRPRCWRALEVTNWKPSATTRPTCVYWHWDATGKLLYVGIALSALRRMSKHALESHWFDQVKTISIERYATRELARAAEAQAIATFRPRYNVKMNRG